MTPVRICLRQIRGLLRVSKARPWRRRHGRTMCSYWTGLVGLGQDRVKIGHFRVIRDFLIENRELLRNVVFGKGSSKNDWKPTHREFSNLGGFLGHFWGKFGSKSSILRQILKIMHGSGSSRTVLDPRRIRWGPMKHGVFMTRAWFLANFKFSVKSELRGLLLKVVEVPPSPWRASAPWPGSGGKNLSKDKFLNAGREETDFSPTLFR